MTADEVLESETVIESLRGPLAAHSKSVLNLRFPDRRSVSVFEKSATVNDLGARAPRSWTSILDLGVRQARWPVTSGSDLVKREELSLWNDFLTTVDFFHHFGFYNVRGAFADGDKSRYATESGFKGLAQMRSGTVVAVKGHLHIGWHEQPRTSKGDEATSWLIEKMTLEDFELYEAERPLFSDVAYEALDESDWSRLLPSVDEGMMLDMVLRSVPGSPPSRRIWRSRGSGLSGEGTTTST